MGRGVEGNSPLCTELSPMGWGVHRRHGSGTGALPLQDEVWAALRYLILASASLACEDGQEAGLLSCDQKEQPQ